MENLTASYRKSSLGYRGMIVYTFKGQVVGRELINIDRLTPEDARQDAWQEIYDRATQVA